MASAAEFEDWAPMVCKGVSAVQPLGDHESKCGYCSSPDGFASFGALTRRLTCTDYQALIDHNWRRSGTYMYRPSLDAACCPLLTIRLDVEAFRATKQQNQLLRRMQRFLDGEIDLLGPADAAEGRKTPISTREAAKPARDSAAQRAAALLNVALAEAVNAAADAGTLPPSLRDAVLTGAAAGSHPDVVVRAAGRAARPAALAAQAAGADGDIPVFSSPVAMRLAASARRAGSVAPSAAEAAAAVATAWSASPACVALATAAVSGSGPPFINFTVTGADVLAELVADSAGSESPADQDTAAAGAGAGAGTGGKAGGEAVQLPRKHQLRVVSVPAAFEQESFELYKRYQKAVHGDKEESLTAKQYSGFLCESPLLPMPLDGRPEDPVAAAAEEVASLSGAPADLCRLALAAAGSVSDAADLLKTARGRISDRDLRERLAGAAAEGVQGYSLAALAALAKAGREGEGSGAGMPALAEGGAMRDPAATAPASSAGVSSAGASAAASGEAGSFSGFGPGAVAHGFGADDAEGGTALSGGFGSYHHKYYLDDRLVAVGVVDVLPNCLSSVYVFYDPDLPRLQLGRYTALREIQWVQAVHERLPRLRYYYMGYYVHSCQKMRYKADYRPSELLCPVTGRWVHHHKAKPILDKHRFARIAGTEGGEPPAGAPPPPTEDTARSGGAAADCKACDARRASVAHLLPPADPEAEEAAKAWAERVPLLLVRAKQDCVVGQLTAGGRSMLRPLLAQFAKLATPAVADRCLAYF